MSNPVYSRPARAAQEAEEEEYYEEAQEERPAGLFSSPGRTFALAGSILALLVVFGAIIFMIGAQQTTTGTTTGAVSSNAPVPKDKIGPASGYYAPDFTLTDVRTNQPLKLSSLRGKPVWVNFWGTWCPPCRAEMPEMQKVFDRYKGQIEVLGVSMGPRDTPDLVRNFLGEHTYNWTFIHDADYNVAQTYAVASIPSSYFIDREGVIRQVAIGGIDSTRMENFLASIK